MYNDRENAVIHALMEGTYIFVVQQQGLDIIIFFYVKYCLSKTFHHTCRMWLYNQYISLPICYKTTGKNTKKKKKCLKTTTGGNVLVISVYMCLMVEHA